MNLIKFGNVEEILEAIMPEDERNMLFIGSERLKFYLLGYMDSDHILGCILFLTYEESSLITTIEYIYVTPEERGRSLSVQLVKDGIEYMGRLGYSKVVAEAYDYYADISGSLLGKCGFESKGYKTMLVYYISDISDKISGVDFSAFKKYIDRMKSYDELPPKVAKNFCEEAEKLVPGLQIDKFDPDFSRFQLSGNEVIAYMGVTKYSGECCMPMWVYLKPGEETKYSYALLLINIANSCKEKFDEDAILILYHDSEAETNIESTMKMLGRPTTVFHTFRYVLQK